MFQGKGTVLERCVEIGLGQVPGITGLRKKAKIGDPIYSDYLDVSPEFVRLCSLPEEGMDKHQDRQDKIQG